MLTMHCRQEHGAMCWEVELLPDAAKNNFTHWCGFIVHKGEACFSPLKAQAFILSCRASSAPWISAVPGPHASQQCMMKS